MHGSFKDPTYIRQATNELVRESLDASLFYKLLLYLDVGILPFSTDKPKLDIVVDGVVEETWFLLHQTDLCPPPLEIDLPQVPSPDRDGTVSPVKTLEPVS